MSALKITVHPQKRIFDEKERCALHKQIDIFYLLAVHAFTVVLVLSEVREFSQHALFHMPHKRKLLSFFHAHIGKERIYEICDGEIVLDLGSLKTFSSYTLYNAGVMEDESYNATSWELLWSNDTNYFVPLDYQKDCKENVATFETGEVTCRYILLKLYVPDSGPGTVRLYELTAGN